MRLDQALRTLADIPVSPLTQALRTLAAIAEQAFEDHYQDEYDTERSLVADLQLRGLDREHAERMAQAMMIPITEREIRTRLSLREQD